MTKSSNDNYYLFHYVILSNGDRKEVLVLEQFQTVFLIQIAAPELLVILCICEIFVNGWRSVPRKSFWSTYYCTITRTEKRSHWHSCFISIHHSSMPNTFVLAITQRLEKIIVDHDPHRKVSRFLKVGWTIHFSQRRPICKLTSCHWIPFLCFIKGHVIMFRWNLEVYCRQITYLVRMLKCIF